MAIGTKFVPPHACIFMDYIEREFLKNEQIEPWIWFRYIDDIFFIWSISIFILTHATPVIEKINCLQPSPQNEKNMLQQKCHYC